MPHIQSMIGGLDPRVVLFAICMTVGVVLLLFGRLLTRPLCVFLGCVGGTIAGFILAEQTGLTGGIAIAVLCMAGALAGTLASWLLFRLWMGLSLAVLMMVVLGWGIPSVTSPWLGTRDTTAAEPAPDTAELHDIAGKVIGAELRAATRPGTTDDHATLIEGTLKAGRAIIAQTRGWWGALPARGRQLAIAAGVIGLIHGLVLGLWKPQLAASLQTAFAGALLLVYAQWSAVIPNILSQETLARLHSTWPAAVAVGLITILGVIVQWTIQARKADK